MWCVSPLHCQGGLIKCHAINSVNNSQRLKRHRHKGLVLDATLQHVALPGSMNAQPEAPLFVPLLG